MIAWEGLLPGKVWRCFTWQKNLNPRPHTLAPKPQHCYGPGALPNVAVISPPTVLPVKHDACCAASASR